MLNSELQTGRKSAGKYFIDLLFSCILYSKFDLCAM